ncbi:hypothetical protein, partial [uncultured Bacteroides sp.]|uniref:hypothetical protein n=1 Tax=uncultured Bacteroides sp. TaxID=162156 RepID=UPI00280A7BFC
LVKSSSKEATSKIYLIKPISLLMFRRVMVIGSLRCGKISPDSSGMIHNNFGIFKVIQKESSVYL